MIFISMFISIESLFCNAAVVIYFELFFVPMNEIISQIFE